MLEEQEYLSLKKATEFCSYTQEYLSLRARQGKLKAVKFGRNWVTRKDWLQEYLETINEYNQRFNNFVTEITEENEITEEKKIVLPPRNLPVENPLKLRRLVFSSVLVFTLLISGFAFGKINSILVENFAAGDVPEIFNKVKSFSDEVVILSAELAENFNRGVAAEFENLNLKIENSGKSFSSSVYSASVGELLGEYGQWIIQNYLAVNDFVEQKLTQAGRAVAEPFVRTYRFIAFPWKIFSGEEIVFLDEAAKEKLEILQKELTQLKEEGLTVKEVERVTQIEPFKEITREIVKIDDKALSDFQVRLALFEIETKQELAKRPQGVNLPSYSFLSPGGASSVSTLGTITSGTWNASTITVPYGGTGLTLYAVGDLLYASATNTLAKLEIAAVNTVLTSSGSAPQWSTSLNLAGNLSLAGTSSFTGTSTFSGSLIVSGVSGLPAGSKIEMGTIDAPAYNRRQIWNSLPNSILRLGALTSDGDSFNTTSEGIIIYGQNAVGNDMTDLNWGYARIKQDRFSLYSKQDGVYTGDIFRIDLSDDNFYLRDNSGNKVFDFLRASGRLYITGNMGIGTTTPAALLDVYASSTAYGLSVKQQMTGGIADFKNATGSVFTIINNGNVGIGTSAPQAPLDILTSAIAASGVEILRLKYLPGDYTNKGGKLTFATNANVITGEIINDLDSGADGRLRFGVYGNSALRSDLLVIRGNGNVGIGTTTPTAILTIQGTSSSPIFHAVASSSASALYIANNGNVGIGTVSPSAKLDIAVSYNDGTGGVLPEQGVQFTFGTYPVAGIWSDKASGGHGSLILGASTGTNAPTEVMRITNTGNVGIGTTTVARGLVVWNKGSAVCASSDGSCPASDTAGNSYATTRSGGEIDVAEWIKYNISDLKPEPGDVICASSVNKETVEHCRASYDKNIVGVVSTAPHLTMGSEIAGKDAVRMTLTGRVPVKVSIENGPIVIGDVLTSSVQPGVAMKATRAGRVIGIALENYDGYNKDGKIMIFINPHWQGNDLNIVQNDDGKIVNIKLQQGLASFGLMVNEYGVLEVDTLKTRQLCVGSVCVTEAEFQAIFGTGRGGNGGSDGSSDDDGTSKGETSPDCDATHLNLCSTELDCQTAGGVWDSENNVCNSKPEPQCDKEHLDLCNTKELCEGANLYWYNDVCNLEQAPEPELETEPEPKP